MKIISVTLSNINHLKVFKYKNRVLNIIINLFMIYQEFYTNKHYI